MRLQREAEQRDELRVMYQLREQEIISQLLQLENKQYDMVGVHFLILNSYFPRYMDAHSHTICRWDKWRWSVCEANAS